MITGIGRLEGARTGDGNAANGLIPASNAVAMAVLRTAEIVIRMWLIFMETRIDGLSVQTEGHRWIIKYLQRQGVPSPDRGGSEPRNADRALFRGLGGCVSA